MDGPSLSTLLLKVTVSILLSLAPRCHVLTAIQPTGSPPPPAAAFPPCPHSLQVNNSGAGEGSLLQALKAAHQCNNTSLEIRLGKGHYVLSNSTNNLLTFVSWRNITLTGQGIDVTVLQCGEGAGLVFRNSSLVTLQGLTLEWCGRLFTSTSVSVSDSDPVDMSHAETKFVESVTAVYFEFCSNLTLRAVKVSRSIGTGVTIYNTNGNNTFMSCQFVSNRLNPNDSPHPGGGGVVIETSHCAPGDATCKDNSLSKLETRNSSYIFESCEFISNRATSHYLTFNSIYPHGRDHMGLGRGGGLSIIFKGRAVGNSVVVNNCDLNTNLAEWGGAMYLTFGDTSTTNSILINSSNFIGNNYRLGDQAHRPDVTVGGALRIEMVSYPPDPLLWPGYVSNVSGNSIVVSNTHFNLNFGTWGGAVSFATTRNIPGQILTNSLHFKHCVFSQNRASFVGSAIDITSWKPDLVESVEPFMQPLLQDCSFRRNEMLFLNITDYTVGMGVVYIIEVPTKFAGITEFVSNIGTAMAVSETFISVLESSSMNFTLNSGRRGGALALIGNAWLIANEHTHFLFDRNSVGTYGLGGAVYSVHFGEHDLIYDQNCFFRYHKFTIPPSEWNATFVFRDNQVDHQPNSIYTTSSQPCMWGGMVPVESEAGPFCEESTWVFEGAGRNCSNEIATGPQEVVVTSIDIKVVPGWNTTLGIKTLNDFGSPIPSVFTASPSEDEDHERISVANSTKYISNDGIVIYGQENTHANLLLMTLVPRVIASQVAIHVLSCPPGFMPVLCDDESLTGKTCDCVCSDTPGILCSNETKEAYLKLLNCISYSHNQSSLVVGSCPYNHVTNFPLSNLTAEMLDERVCGQFNRQGFLCSKCREGYGVAVNRYDYPCVSCKGGEKYYWVFFLLAELGPITVVCFLVILFGVSMASPSMNAFVFFSQIVSVTYNRNIYIWFFGVEHFSKSLSYPIFTLYGVWNLELFRNVLPAFCLHEGLSTLHILVINYVKALYPMFLLGICYVSIKLYDRNFRIFHLLWKPLRYCQKVMYKSHKPKTTIVDAFATLIILSYSKFMYVSFPLVDIISVHELGGNVTGLDSHLLKYRYYFDSAEVLHHSMTNVVYFILGIIVLVVFVCFPPLFLILYPLKAVQLCIGRLNIRIQIGLKTFADIFLGAFRDGTDGGRDCRWFAGFYFIFRIIFLGLYAAATLEPTAEYLIQQILCTLGIFLFALVRPYKEEWYNYLDTSFFTLMAVLNSLSFYNSHLEAAKNDIQPVVFFINYILVYLPIVYLIVLFTHHILMWQGCFSHAASKSRGSEVDYCEVMSEGGSTSDDITAHGAHNSLPDRFVHPQNYRTLEHFSSHQTRRDGGGMGSSGGSEHDRDGTDQLSTNNLTPLLRGHLVGPYGSVQVGCHADTA